MPSTRPRSAYLSRRRTLLVASVTVVALTLVGAACTDDGVDTGTGTTTTRLAEETDVVTVDDPLAVPTYTDPTSLITAAIGERFALVLPAEPTEGFRWEVVERPDPAVVLSRHRTVETERHSRGQAIR